jgi:hypothetical protein
MHNFTGFEPVDNTVGDVKKTSKEAGLDKVMTEYTAVG